MKTDLALQQDVREELLWDPILNTSDIGVAVKDGIVTLTGDVTSYGKKLVAEKAARRVKEVRSVVTELAVCLPEEEQRTDEEITEAAWNAMKWSSFVPDDCIRLQVKDGWITIAGEVEWQFQKESASAAVRHLMGVHGVSNQIKVRPRITPIIIKDVIKRALERSAGIAADQIQIVTDGGRIVLKGKVRSWVERKEVERAVWATPGVIEVKDELTIEP